MEEHVEPADPHVEHGQREFEHAFDDSQPVQRLEGADGVGHGGLDVLRDKEDEQADVDQQLEHTPQQPSHADARGRGEGDLVAERRSCHEVGHVAHGELLGVAHAVRQALDLLVRAALARDELALAAGVAAVRLEWSEFFKEGVVYDIK